MPMLSSLRNLPGVQKNSLMVSRVFPIERDQGLLKKAREVLSRGEESELIMVDPLVVQAWRRVRDSGGTRDGILNPVILSVEELRERILQRVDIFEAAKPFFDILGDLVGNLVPVFVISIADEEGYILDVRTDSQTASEAGEKYFIKGALHSETNIGNNGLGTALVTGKSVVIAGAEHYNEMFDNWTSFGTPILGLVGEVKGAISVTVPNDYAVSHVVTILRAMANGIEAHTNKLSLQQQLVLKQRDYDRVSQKAIADYEKMDVGVVLLNDALTVVLWNKAAERITGVRREQVLGRNIYQLPDLPETAHLVEQFLNSEASELNDQIVRARFDGRDVLLTLSIRVANDRTVVLTFKEVGHFENKEQALQLFDHLPFAMILSDLNDRIVFVNRAWCDASGLGPEFVLGRTRRELANHTQLIDIPGETAGVRPRIRLIRLNITEIRPYLIEHFFLEGSNGTSTLSIFEDAERLTGNFFNQGEVGPGGVSATAPKEQVPVSIHWREIRKTLGFNQSEFSQRMLGVNPGQYLMYEKGAKFPSLPNTLKFARKCGVPVEFIYRLLDEDTGGGGD
jgi:PAS domain S-box-containing protein